MARTGISIQISNTTLGSPPSVNSNSMLIVYGATAVATGTMPFTLKNVYMLQSIDDLKVLGITDVNNKDVFRQVTDYFSRAAGSILWLVGVAATPLVATDITEFVRKTIIGGFQYRPRQIIVSVDWLTQPLPAALQGVLQTAIDALYVEGFSCVGLVSNSFTTTIDLATDLSLINAPLVGTVSISNRINDRACVGLIGGFMATLSVGTSIGDSSLPQFGSDFYMMDVATGTPNTLKNTPCSRLTLAQINLLGDHQHIFARTRPPRNGLWLNDGATGADPSTSLSTLEAGRVIAAMVDETRSFFTPYINGRVPVNASGDIDSAYRQVVLDNARSRVIQPFIASGDISNASMTLRAKNNDFLGTRTWEVALAIQSASTLRWIDAFVFYVKEL